MGAKKRNGDTSGPKPGEAAAPVTNPDEVAALAEKRKQTMQYLLEAAKNFYDFKDATEGKLRELLSEGRGNYQDLLAKFAGLTKSFEQFKTHSEEYFRGQEQQVEDYLRAAEKRVEEKVKETFGKRVDNFLEMRGADLHTMIEDAQAAWKGLVAEREVIKQLHQQMVKESQQLVARIDRLEAGFEGYQKESRSFLKEAQETSRRQRAEAQEIYKKQREEIEALIQGGLRDELGTQLVEMQRKMDRWAHAVEQRALEIKAEIMGNQLSPESSPGGPGNPPKSWYYEHINPLKRAVEDLRSAIERTDKINEGRMDELRKHVDARLAVVNDRIEALDGRLANQDEKIKRAGGIAVEARNVAKELGQEILAARREIPKEAEKAWQAALDKKSEELRGEFTEGLQKTNERVDGLSTAFEKQHKSNEQALAALSEQLKGIDKKYGEEVAGLKGALKDLPAELISAQKDEARQLRSDLEGMVNRVAARMGNDIEGFKDSQSRHAKELEKTVRDGMDRVRGLEANLHDAVKSVVAAETTGFVRKEDLREYEFRMGTRFEELGKALEKVSGEIDAIDRRLTPVRAKVVEQFGNLPD